MHTIGGLLTRGALLGAFVEDQKEASSRGDLGVADAIPNQHRSQNLIQ
jgi:hypothetical protein